MHVFVCCYYTERDKEFLNLNYYKNTVRHKNSTSIICVGPANYYPALLALFVNDCTVYFFI